jgi:hypothetical protein
VPPLRESQISPTLVLTGFLLRIDSIPSPTHRLTLAGPPPCQPIELQHLPLRRQEPPQRCQRRCHLRREPLATPTWNRLMSSPTRTSSPITSTFGDPLPLTLAGRRLCQSRPIPHPGITHSFPHCNVLPPYRSCGSHYLQHSIADMICLTFFSFPFPAQAVTPNPNLARSFSIVSNYLWVITASMCSLAPTPISALPISPGAPLLPSVAKSSASVDQVAAPTAAQFNVSFAV